MFKKMMGSVLMIIGTAVGAGMLALPIVTAHQNFLMTFLVMLFSWSFMTIGAFAILEVNLWFPPGANLITMVDKTLGVYAKQVIWFVYLLLFYSLLCAYLAGTSDILQGLLQAVHVNLPPAAATLSALIFLSFIVFKGISTVDIVNRLFMGTKLLVYVILVACVLPHVSLTYLTQGQYTLQTNPLMIMMTAFGFATIVPTLRVYLKSDPVRLKNVILGASLLALLIYLLWTLSVQGLLGRQGANGLFAILASKEPNSLLMQSMGMIVNNAFLSTCSKIFISICAVTSFLGVALCVTDFIADGFQYEKKGFDGLKIYAFTFLPPLLIVLFFPGIFIKALSYAGICCVFLLALLPVLMLYQGRYKKIFIKTHHTHMVPGGKIVLIIMIIISIGLLIMQISELLGY